MVSARPASCEEAHCQILVVDDHPLSRDAMISVIQAFSSLDVSTVSEAESGEEGVAHARACRPALILMDIGLPGISGLEAASRIRDDLPSAAIVMVTAMEERGQRELAAQFGAAGFVLKDRLVDELPPLLAQVATRPGVEG